MAAENDASFSQGEGNIVMQGSSWAVGGFQWYCRPASRVPGCSGGRGRGFSDFCWWVTEPTHRQTICQLPFLIANLQLKQISWIVPKKEKKLATSSERFLVG